MSAGMRLSALAEAVGGRIVAAGASGPASDASAPDASASNGFVRGVRHDSRAVQPGELFVAMAGARMDGARFAADAVRRGAVAVAAERELGDLSIPQLVVRDARRALPRLAHQAYGDPTAGLRVVGVTGTNGKTTVTWLLDQALRTLGERPSRLGTLPDSALADTTSDAATAAPSFTTPEADDIARFASRAVERGATHLVMEVSSHGLALHRADDVHYEVAAFTNLTQDHLDFHGSMEAYFEAKARLFLELAPKQVVLPIDDPWARRIDERLDPEVPRIFVSRSEGAADICAEHAASHRDGLRAALRIEAALYDLTSPLIGAHNLDNILLAAGCLLALGHQPAEVVDALGRCTGAPGRLERVDAAPSARTAPMVLVDYAHTPDALLRVLEALRPLTPGRLIAVVGCGGDRDREKRPLMGRAAAGGADGVVATSDNPRSEDPYSILADLERGLSPLLSRVEPAQLQRRGGYAVVEDRAKAIEVAIGAAGPADTVLIAGKGHETYQIRGDEIRHFDDRAVAREALAGPVAGRERRG